MNEKFSFVVALAGIYAVNRADNIFILLPNN